MPLKDIDVKSAIDELYTKYSGNRTDYITLRTELETINKMILNQAANVYYDSSDISYAAINRKDKELAGIEKSFAKDRLYGIVLYRLVNSSNYVYIDVPGKTSPILDPDIFYTEPDLELSKYKEYLFEADSGDYLSIPVIGGIASVKVPHNFPEHIYTNAEDAIFLNMKRPDILVSINDAAQTARPVLSGGSGSGLGLINSPFAPAGGVAPVNINGSTFIPASKGPGNVKFNKQAFIQAMNRFNILDNDLRAAIAGVIEGETRWVLKTEVSYAGTELSGVKAALGPRLSKLSDQQIEVLKKDPQKFFEYAYGCAGRGRTANGNGCLGNDTPGDGYKYRGRGFIQITFKGNYRDVGNKIGRDLVANPDLLNNPFIAAEATIAFLRTNLPTYSKYNTNLERVIRTVSGGVDIKKGRDIKTAAYQKYKASGEFDYKPSVPVS